ncbi:VCBS repeat-containing protein [Aliiroseovarius sp. F20344]|uniref:FG-GAP repeat domain-containing protein n=1 Tax=Aliiroseovarius sp. F20344 TaxID=2926414 RepID=UPI001FF1A546|nr:VCBS repeat-containing protein [Aliiroseovarius sp. F20344]MCK0142683.1 VCBS repeat-containing protein [Aliiroseovarius sp. F20344]
MIGLRTILFAFCLATPATAQITDARYLEPTTRYGHGAVPGGEYGALEVTLDDGRQIVLRVSGGVFEDTIPRLYDFNGDGVPEIVTVFSGDDVGAMIRIYGWHEGELKPVGTSKAIGTRHRWLAVAGIADFNGDGLDEIAYVDRPHLARRLRLLTVDLSAKEAAFNELSSVGGLTNHKYGSPVIEGGVRICDGHKPVVVTASANWFRVIETHFDGQELILSNVAPYKGEDSLSSRLGC